ncbi:ras-related protein Rap-2c isoform X1 [Equus asinus]|uniref:ras-related protein Rap-2c isoform X1 n=1 Tax=Equus asinus TaxID=9793 RepID=UPI0038F6398C
MSGVLPVVRLLLAVLHRPTSGSSPRPGWGRLRRGGVSEVWGWGWRAGGERKDAGGSQTGPQPRPSAGPEAVRSHRPPPSRSAGRGPAPPGSPPRGGTFPTGSDRVQSRGTGAPQPVCQRNPSGPDDARGSRGAEPRPGGSDWSGARRPGPARRPEQEAGSRGPFVCTAGEGRRAARGPRAAPPSLRGRVSPPPLAERRGALLPAPPARAWAPIGRASRRLPTPPTLRSSPPPPQLPLLPRRALAGCSAIPPRFAHFRPPSASRPLQRAGVLFPPSGRSR